MEDFKKNETNIQEIESKKSPEDTKKQNEESGELLNKTEEYFKIAVFEANNILKNTENISKNSEVL